MSVSLKSLDQQVVVITGASSGIGLRTSELAAERSAKVVLSARSEQTLNEIAGRLKSQGCDCIAVGADVSSRDDMQRLADEAIRRFGRIDTWVNNAGVAIYGPLTAATDEENRRLFDINFWGVVNGSFAALPHLRKQGGALINIGSEVSDAYFPLLGMYVASKHAVKGFTDCLRVEIERIEKAPVSITLIQPTAVDTPFDEHARNYMDKAANLPTPMIDSTQVAEAILAAATKPTREKKVGTMSKVNAFTAKNLPRMADRMVSKQTDQLKRDEPPLDAEGTLFIPGESGRTHGDHAKA